MYTYIKVAALGTLSYKICRITQTGGCVKMEFIRQLSSNQDFYLNKKRKITKCSRNVKFNVKLNICEFVNIWIFCNSKIILINSKTLFPFQIVSV